jgi:hypothetical protein
MFAPGDRATFRCTTLLYRRWDGQECTVREVIEHTQIEDVERPMYLVQFDGHNGLLDVFSDELIRIESN